MSEDTEMSLQRANLSGSMQLLRELQHALYEISRRAELNDPDASEKIQHRAEQALKLVDSWIISTQVEAGQMQLKLSPYGVGSIMHEAAHDLRLATNQETSVITGVNQPAMTNALLLRNLLYSAGNFIYDTAKKPIVIRSYSTKSGRIGVGVFASGFNMTPRDLRKSLAMDSSTYMPMAQHSQKSGVMLILADILASALGSRLEIKQLGGKKGFAAVLPKSRQLSLIGD